LIPSQFIFDFVKVCLNTVVFFFNSLSFELFPFFKYINKRFKACTFSSTGVDTCTYYYG